jgi:hypothetical protein
LTGDALIERLHAVCRRLGLDAERLISGEIRAPRPMGALEYADTLIEAEATEVIEQPAAVPDWCGRGKNA